MADVFISYSRKDEVFARQLAESLSIAELDVWIDVDDIPVGMKWSSAIEKGLQYSQLMIVIITPDSMQSRNVEDEWQYFRDKNKPIVPVLRRPAEVHYQLARYQRIDFYTQSYDEGLEQLFREMSRLGLDMSSASVPEIAATLLSRPASQTLLMRPPELEAPVIKEKRKQRSGTAAIIAVVVLLLAVGLAAFLFLRQLPSDTGDAQTSTAAVSLAQAETESARATVIAADQVTPSVTATLSATPNSDSVSVTDEVTSTLTLTVTATTGVMLTTTSVVNVRDEDDPTGTIVGTLQTGQQIIGLGINRFKQWWYIEYTTADGSVQRGWVFDGFIKSPNDISSVPVLTVEQARALP